MPNNKYVRSTKKERELVNRRVTEGCDVSARTAGSKSKGEGFPTDVFSVNHTLKEVKLSQIKTTKGARKEIVKSRKEYDGYKVIEELISYE